MREYTLNRAHAAGSIGMSLAILFHNWRARRRIAKLVECSNGILRTISPTRDDLRWAVRLPLSQDPDRALEDRAFRNSRA